jgi:ABC-2 type transport system ATP-binding protein
MIESVALDVAGVSHRYGARQALNNVSFSIAAGQIVAILGPNGGGKTTLFRLLSTLIPLQAGSVHVLGASLANDVQQVRRSLGVVFQAPSLDKKLSVAENIKHQGHLYGLAGAALVARQRVMLAALGLSDRANARVETLSGGMRRRVELAKGLIHEPRVLLLDEPSTGLDPAARSDLWAYLRQARAEQGVTIVLTTHLLEEADKADRIGILHAGELVAWDTPDALRATVGGDAITIVVNEPERVRQAIVERFGLDARVVDDAVRLEQPNGHEWIARIVEAFPGQIQSITLGKPTLEDVFIDRTGHRFLANSDEPAPAPSKSQGH